MFHFISVPFIQLWMAERIEIDIPIGYKLHVFIDVECTTVDQRLPDQSNSKMLNVDSWGVEMYFFRIWNLFNRTMSSLFVLFFWCVIEFSLFVKWKYEQSLCSLNPFRYLVRICGCMIMISVYFTTFVHSW